MYERKNDYNFWRLLGIATGQDPDMWRGDVEEAFYYVIYPLACRQQLR